MSAPILTDTLIDRVMREQRQHLRPPNGWGHAAWPLCAEEALGTLTSEGWCHLGWIERVMQSVANNPPRFQIWWHVDTGDARLEQEPRR